MTLIYYVFFIYVQILMHKSKLMRLFRLFQHSDTLCEASFVMLISSRDRIIRMVKLRFHVTRARIRYVFNNVEGGLPQIWGLLSL